MPEETETAVFAGGCFWPAQDLLSRRPGVLATRVGYTGGENDHPTPDRHPGHAEAVEVIFDPAQTSYRELLEFFLQVHRADLDEDHVGFDYRSEIFTFSDAQRDIAAAAIAAVDAAGLWPGPIVTKVSEAVEFWEAPAEDQEYFRHYPDGKDQLHSRQAVAD